MHRITILLFVLALLAIGGGSAWYLMRTSGNSLGSAEEVATSTPLTDAQGIYTNGTYGFSIFYPEEARIEYGFDPGYHLGTAWRAQALPESQGNPILSIIPYAIQNERSYPRYFNAMVRIGASEDPQEIARCEKRSENQGETQLADTTIGGQAWKTFAFQDAGMMQYASGVSYRLIHEGKCIAIEKVRTGSSYREDLATASDVPQETLDAEYAKLERIVQSFSFAR